MNSIKSGSDGISPLLNDVVVKEILSYSSVRDLKRHRLVCRKWYQVSLPKWKSESTVKLYQIDSKRPIAYCISTQIREGLSVKSLLSFQDKEEEMQGSPFKSRKTILQSASKPFEKYCFKNWDFSQALNEDSLEFFTRLGPNIKSIILECCDIDHQIGGMIGFTPHLEALTMHNPPWYQLVDKDLLGLIFNGTNQNLRLKHLDLSISNCYNITEQLQQNYPHVLSQLESLGISVKDMLPHAVIPVVELYRETLKYLTLSRHFYNEELPILEFTQEFEKLSELRILGRLTNSLSFLQLMPKLKTLMIKEYAKFNLEFESAQPANQGATLMSSIQDVVLLQMNTLWIDVELDWNSLKMLKNCAPNLRSLNTKLTNSTFIAVTAFWPDLKEVQCLFGSDLDDWGLIPNVVDKGRLQHLFAEETDVGITALKNLERFRVEGFNGSAKLTELSAEEGFLKLDNLKVLKLFVHTKFSFKMIKELEAKVAHVTIVRKRKHQRIDGSVCDALSFREVCEGSSNPYGTPFFVP